MELPRPRDKVWILGSSICNKSTFSCYLHHQHYFFALHRVPNIQIPYNEGYWRIRACRYWGFLNTNKKPVVVILVENYICSYCHFSFCRKWITGVDESDLTVEECRDENLLEGQEDIGFWMNDVKTEEILYQIDLFIQDSQYCNKSYPDASIKYQGISLELSVSWLCCVFALSKSLDS